MSNPTDSLIAELLPLARLYAGMLDKAPAAIQAVTFAFDDRIVEARQTRSGSWAFKLKGHGRGRTPGLHRDRLGRDYHTALGDLQKLCDGLKRRSVESLKVVVEQSRWLCKFGLWWTPAKPADVPPWLRSRLEDTWTDAYGAEGEREQPPRYFVRVPLTKIADIDSCVWCDHHRERHNGGKRCRERECACGAFVLAKMEPIRDPESAATVTFEGEPLDLPWNHFVVGAFVPSDIAAQIVGLYHAQLVRHRKSDGPKKRLKPLAPSYVLRQKSSRRA